MLIIFPQPAALRRANSTTPSISFGASCRRLFAAGRAGK